LSSKHFQLSFNKNISYFSLKYFLTVNVSGDEILSINGQVLQGMTHGQAISVFKNIKQGAVSLHIARRLQPQLPAFGKSFRKFQSQSCEELEILEE